MLIHAFTTSRLDYINGLLYGLPNSQIVKLQRVQNAAARLVLSLSKNQDIDLKEKYYLCSEVLQLSVVLPCWKEKPQKMTRNIEINNYLLIIV